MSNSIKSRLILLPFLLLCGCDNDPLVFSSGQTAGIKIKIAPSETGPLSLTVGYDSVDAAIIPTTMDPARQRIASSRSRPVVDKQEIIDNARTAQSLMQRNSDPGNQRASAAFARVIDTLQAQPNLAEAPNLVEVPPSAQRDVAAAISDLRPGSPERAAANALQAQLGHDSQDDALSVISTFNLDARAGAQPKGAGAALGKTFATGVAAQYIGQGLGQSLTATAVAECLKEANQMQGEAQKSAVAACGR